MRSFVVMLLLGSSALLGACSGRNADTPKRDLVPVTVRISVAQTRSLPEIVAVPGTVTRARHARLASPYGGRVTSTPVAAGSMVQRGELLLAVGAADARSRLAAAQANAVSQRAEARQAATDEARFKALLNEGAVAPREYEQIHQRDVATRAQARSAEQALTAARSSLQDAEVRAPFAGLLVERPVKVGDYAAPGTLLAVVVGGAAEVELQVGDTLYPHLPLKTRIEVSVDQQVYPARVVERVDAADPTTRTHLVKLRVDGNPAPSFGAYAVAEVPVGTRQAAVIPADAIIERAGLKGVFVVDAQGRTQFRPVLTATGGSAGTTVIASGLQADERVIRAPPLALGNGSVVRGTADSRRD